MKRQKSRLFYLALSVFLPPIGIMLLAATDLIYSQKNLVTLARSYVENFTESVASGMERGGEIRIMGGVMSYEDYDGSLVSANFAGLGRLPVFVVVLDSSGSFLYGSSRLRDLIRYSGTQFPMGMAKELLDVNGERFTVCVFPSPQAHFLVVGAISWKDLPGATIRLMYLWPLLIGFVGMWSAIAIWRLWLKVIRPLRELEAEVSDLRWGEEVPAAQSRTRAIYELRELRSTLVDVAKDTIKRVSMIRTCMNDIVSVQEAERTKISRDIHDGPLQDVTALIQRIRLAKSPNNTQAETAEELAMAEKIALATVREMRGLCDFLNPPWLELGLKQALTELTERQSAQYDVRIFLDVEEGLDISDSVTLAFFRVVQEAVSNSVRHGAAKNIWVEVSGEDKGLVLTVQDDGRGFDMDASGTTGLRVAGHRGLSNMEERMALVGGNLCCK